MALIGFEGFEHRYNSTNYVRGVFAISGGSVIGYPAGRFGGYAMYGQTSGALSTPNGSYTGLYMGAAFFTLARNDYFSVYGPENTGVYAYLALHVGSNGELTLSRSGSAADIPIGTSPPGTVIIGAWNYFEMYVGPFSATTGRVIVRANGNVVFDYTGNTLGNTVNNDLPGNVAFMRLRTANGSSQMDDVYLCDDQGPAPYNTFLGDVRVETLVPNNNGSFSQLLGSDGNSVDNYQLVDEQPAVITDYVGSATIGQRDTYQFTDLVSTNVQVLGVQTFAAATKSDAGIANIKTIERLASGTERLSGAIALPASLGMIGGGVRTTDPAGAAWTMASVNAAQFGVEVA